MPKALKEFLERSKRRMQPERLKTGGNFDTGRPGFNPGEDHAAREYASEGVIRRLKA